MKLKRPPSGALSPLLLFFAVALVAFFFLSSRFSGFAVTEFERFNRGMADSGAENADQMVERLKGFAQNRLEDPDLLAWLTAPNPDAMADYKAEWGLLRSFASEPFVSGALLLAPDRGYLLDTRTRRWAWSEYPDKGLLSSVSRPASYLRMAAGRDAGGEWLALLLPLAYGPQEAEERTGRTVVLILNRPLVERFILQSDQVSSPFRAFVLDASGRVLLGQAPGEAAASGSWAFLVSGGPIDLQKRIGSQSWLFSARELEREDWTLVRAARLEELGEKAVRFELLLVAALVVLVLLYWAGLKWNEARLTRPFRRMEAEHRELARQEAIRTFLASGSLEPQEEALIRQDLGFEPRSFFALCAARIEPYSAWRSHASPDEQHRLRREILAAWEARGRSRGLSCVGIDLGGDTLFLIVQSREAAPAPALVDEILSSGEPALPEGAPSLALASSEISPERDQLRFAVESLRELTYLKYISGEARVYREADMASTLDRQPVQAVQEEADNLSQAVRSGNREELGAAVSGMAARMHDLPYAECRIRLVMISFLLFREFSLQIGGVEGFQGLELSLGAFGSLGEAASWIGQSLAQVQDKLASPAKGTKRLELVADVKAFVNEQLSDFTLNLDRVAAQVGLSPGYLRQIFKNASGQTLSDYIHERRIERIKEQLEHSDLPVSRLVERSGFQTKSHFFTAFKEATGMTPEQYRRSKLS
jgi:AraC-like DNA-binding protein